MPELPEVQVIVNELNQSIVQTQMTSIIEKKERNLQQSPEYILSKIGNKNISQVKRIAKFICFEFEDTSYQLLTHLRMTGKYILSDQCLENNHNRVIFTLNNEKVLIYNDLRRFGTIDCIDKNFPPKSIRALGIDPFDKHFTFNHFQSLLSLHKKVLKDFLMNQSIIVGIGNIYACEILFASKIKPTRLTISLKSKEKKELYHAILNILTQAIECNGTTISDFRSVEDKTGEFQNFLKVYGKAKQTCEICKQPLQVIKQQQRSTFFCGQCQN